MRTPKRNHITVVGSNSSDSVENKDCSDSGRKPFSNSLSNKMKQLFIIYGQGKDLKLENSTEPHNLFWLSVYLFSLSYSLLFLITPPPTFFLPNRPDLLAKARPFACCRRLWRAHAMLTPLTSLHQCVTRGLLNTVVWLWWAEMAFLIPLLIIHVFICPMAREESLLSRYRSRVEKG